MYFFYKVPNLKGNIIIFGEGVERGGGEGARVNVFFFHKESKSKKKKNLFGGRGWAGV